MDIKNKTIVFIGDSITDMNREKVNFWDQNHLYGHSFVFLLASGFGYEFPAGGIKIYNRGISGNKSRDLVDRWQSDVLDLKPDIVNILVGINDIILSVHENKPFSLEEYEKNLSEMVEKTYESAPETQIILCEPFAFPEAAAKEYYDAFKTSVPLLRDSCHRIAKKYGCLFVPLQEVFDKAYAQNPQCGYSHWIWDGIHPTAAGHRIIEAQWKRRLLS